MDSVAVILLGAFIGVSSFAVGIVFIYQKIHNTLLAMNADVQQSEKSLLDEISNLDLTELEETEAGMELLAKYDFKNTRKTATQELKPQDRRKEEELEKIHKLRLDKLSQLANLEAKMQRAESQNRIARMNLEIKELELRGISLFEMAKLNHEKTMKALGVTEQALHTFSSLIEKLPTDKIEQWENSIKTLESLSESIHNLSGVSGTNEKTFKIRKEIESIKGIDGLDKINVIERDNSFQANMRLNLQKLDKPYELSFLINQNYPNEAPSDIKLIDSDGSEIELDPITWTPNMNIASMILVVISRLLHSDIENKVPKLSDKNDKRPLAG